jgi:hypothetical protein
MRGVSTDAWIGRSAAWMAADLPIMPADLHCRRAAFRQIDVPHINE